MGGINFQVTQLRLILRRDGQDGRQEDYIGNRQQRTASSITLALRALFFVPLHALRGMRQQDQQAFVPAGGSYA